MASYHVLKYIVIDDEFTGVEKPYIFTGLDNHRDIANRLNTGRVVSAGFVGLSASGRLSCYGHSESLGIKSRPVEDSKMINTFLYGPDDS